MKELSNWEVVIGIEVHTQLNTVSKIFSGASTAFGAEPNRQACAIDLALPGVLPVLNKGAVERAIRFGLAVNGQVANYSQFDRKNYFYPDLPKAYQISQFEYPIVNGGHITFQVGSDKPYTKTVRLTRAHLEEDAGKSLHHDFPGMSGIDLNRAGTPLLEIVSEPEIYSIDEAQAYARALHTLVKWIGITDGNMQEGSFRCDVNVSIRRPGQALGTRREIKNLNSFRFLQQALEYEIAWQIATLEEGGKIVQATVLFDPDRGETRVMRTKEDAHDYRYFPDPDLYPVLIDAAWIDQVQQSMPELPQQMRQRWQQTYGLSDYDTNILTDNVEMAQFYQHAINLLPQSDERTLGKLCKQLANWMMSDVAATLNRENLGFHQISFTPQDLCTLVLRVHEQTISNNSARKVFTLLWQARQNADLSTSVDQIIESQGLKQLSDNTELQKIIEHVIQNNPKSVEEYRLGKEKALNALVGQVMKASSGKANPTQVNTLLKNQLDQ